MIVTGEIFFSPKPEGQKQLGLTMWQLYEIQTISRALRRVGLSPPQGIILEEPVYAIVNHGRWTARCECGGAEYVWEERKFMCQSCFNAKHKHQYRRVVMPKQRKDIERLLESRPVPNRNWEIGETIIQLEIENIAHKAELLEVK